MLLRTIRFQTAFLLKRKGALIPFYILLVMVLCNFLENVMEFQGQDVVRMYQPVKMLLLSYNKVNYKADMTILFTQLYPILVVCPAGFALAGEYQTGQEVFLTARLGRRRYLAGKAVSVFCVTFLVFTVPFLLELVLNCLSFPLHATGDMSNWNFYERNYIESVRLYPFSRLYLSAPYLYTVLGMVSFGVVSGLLGVFTMAVSAVVRVKYSIFLFLPVFLLLYGTQVLSRLLPEGSGSIGWPDYLLLFNDQVKNFQMAGGILLVVVLFSAAAIHNSMGRDCL